MDEYHKKFAELIVQDCVGIVRNQGPFLRYNAIAEAIQKHFGIKKWTKNYYVCKCWQVLLPKGNTKLN